MLLWVILGLIIVGLLNEAVCATMYVHTRSFGVLEVRERLEIAFAIASCLVLLYAFCAISTGEF